LEEVIRKNQSRPATELVDDLLTEIRLWRPHSQGQQDDITLIAIDVV
jgi:serine phosphatase RsbU (regulator of sigma subunit)